MTVTVDKKWKALRTKDKVVLEALKSYIEQCVKDDRMESLLEETDVTVVDYVDIIRPTDDPK